jgi:hypothetical protein
MAALSLNLLKIHQRCRPVLRASSGRNASDALYKGLSQLLTATNKTSQSTAKTTKAITLNTRIMVSQTLPLPPKLQGHWPAPDWTRANSFDDRASVAQPNFAKLFRSRTVSLFAPPAFSAR